MREQQRFITVVSHELRQPLNAAMGAMSLLDANASAAASDRARLVLRRQLLHMSTLLDDLLDISRLALRTIKIERAPIDLRAVLEDAVETIDDTARKASLTMDVALSASPVPAAGDSSRLQQAFLNLLSNAVRYTPPGGSVKVSMTVAGEAALINIEDTGQGIEPAELPNIFEPFWRGHDSVGDEPRAVASAAGLERRLCLRSGGLLGGDAARRTLRHRRASRTREDLRD